MKKFFFVLCVFVSLGFSASAQQAVFLTDIDAQSAVKEAVADLMQDVPAVTAKQVDFQGQAMRDAILREAKLTAAHLMIELIQDQGNNQASVNRVFEDTFFSTAPVAAGDVTQARQFILSLVTKS